MRSSTTDYFYFRTRQQLKCYIMPHFMATHQVLGEISTVFTLQLKTKMSPLALHFSTLHCFNLVSSSLQSSKRWIYFFVIASVTSIKALCVYLEYVYTDKHDLNSDYMVSGKKKQCSKGTEILCSTI